LASNPTLNSSMRLLARKKIKRINRKITKNNI
jgi:hypothetical protein